MTDADIRAFSPPAGAVRRAPRRLWPWLLLAALAFTLLAAGACAALLFSLVDGLRDHAHVVINGEPWNWPSGDGWGSLWDGDILGDSLGSGVTGFIVATVCIVLAGLLVALIVVPLVVLAVVLAGLGVAFAVAATLGSVGLVVALGVALVFSPLCLFGVLLWLVFRRRPQRAMA